MHSYNSFGLYKALKASSFLTQPLFQFSGEYLIASSASYNDSSNYP